VIVGGSREDRWGKRGGGFVGEGGGVRLGMGCPLPPPLPTHTHTPSGNMQTAPQYEPTG
jgi:hypothetical protein